MSEHNPIQTAADFVNGTSRHIFLTGKAGTGKTTFLRDLAVRTHKNFIICAPTGIAALNAGGVTIHSQFLLPLGSFIPDYTHKLTAEQERGFYTREILFKSHPLNTIRLKVLQSLELLIIDEVSMLRADVLDAIDVRLRAAKNNWKRSFGGVQVLFIGDLFQLPPIYKDSDRAVLNKYYPNIHFFSSQALRQEGFVYVELEKVFRQSDDVFIDVLNNLRQNKITERDRSILNEHYRPDFEGEDGVITLATHNRQVDQINRTSLDELKGESHFYTADVDGDFPESMYPCDVELELKVGAQVMFIKNDTSLDKRYVNGQLAKVVSLEDEITVIIDGEQDEYIVAKEKWENSKYLIEEEEINPELSVVGTFYQFPIKLAWAVTVHKSQGLTFDRAVIDVGSAFAPGQIYVALSRLRSLDGLILRTPVPASAVQNDVDVVRFVEDRRVNQNIEEALDAGRKSYITELVLGTFDLDPTEQKMDKILRGWPKVLNFSLDRLAKWPSTWKEEFASLYNVSKSFKAQLFRLIQEGDKHELISRLEKGAAYFETELKARLKLIYAFQADIQSFKKVKSMNTDLEEMDLMLINVLKRVRTIVEWTKSLYAGGLPEKNVESEKKLRDWRIVSIEKEKIRASEDPELGKGKRRKMKKKVVGEVKTAGESTYEVTYLLVDKGWGVHKIAEKRELTESTVIGHISRGITTGRVELRSILKPSRIEEIAKSYKDYDSLKEWKEATEDEYSYMELRLVLAHLKKP